MKVLIVLTSHSQIGDTGPKTGFWLSEFTDPYYFFVDHRVEIILASPNGGQPTVNPRSEESNYQTNGTRRFVPDLSARTQLANTMKLADVHPYEFDAVFFPGGHGPVWDLAQDKSVIALIESMSAARKPIGAVCHGVAVLRHPKNANGISLVHGRKVTGFSNSEEGKGGLTKVMPYLVEDMLRSNRGLYARADDWVSFVIRDGNLVTGQNPASSKGVVEEMWKLMTETAG
jgi:putative intracellular protease/amidase